MNTPNKITILRMILVPIFMVLLLIESTLTRYLALAVFIIASITDAIDGHLARKYNLITPFGKFMDPLADKMLTTSAFLILLYFSRISVWPVMIVLAREFMVTGVRLLTAAEGKVIAASFWGKLKTVSQMVALIAAIILLDPFFPVETAKIITNILVWISVVLTTLSGIDYLWANRQVFKQ